MMLIDIIIVSDLDMEVEEEENQKDQSKKNNESVPEVSEAPDMAGM